MNTDYTFYAGWPEGTTTADIRNAEYQSYVVTIGAVEVTIVTPVDYFLTEQDWWDVDDFVS